jgi:glycosyltransferase involved in cell wall biosynthesis|tara:strand:- start:809 stop:1744 length:936 start_codon:yes stop_codon:yes gene_type:complete
MSPLGGTELQYQLLYKYVDNSLLENFSIVTSVPEKIPLSLDKINILWQQNSYDQPNLIEWFKNKENHKKYDYYVFNSHWCFEKFRMRFQVPTDRCTVIKNAVEEFPEKKFKRKNKIKMIYHSTPWRGLNVLLGAMQLIKSKDIELDVYSSTQIYGDQFKSANDDQYKELYDQAKSLPNVNYIGYVSNDEIRKRLQNYDVFCFPSIWEETSCISAIESLSAGLHMVTTNYGALYETCSEWPVYINYTENYKHLSQLFAFAIDEVNSYLYKGTVPSFLKSQQQFYKKFYSWERRKGEWTNFLQGLLHEKRSKL